MPTRPTVPVLLLSLARSGTSSSAPTPQPSQSIAIRRFVLPRAIARLSAEALEALRLLEARPLYGRDITEKYLPQETNQPHALHFNKGCYLGQEIVERIRSRGQVHRIFTPFTLTGELP